MMEFQRFENKIWLASPTMHGEELTYMKKVYGSKIGRLSLRQYGLY